MIDFQSARRTMVESQVRPNDVTDLSIQNALLQTPKEDFLPSDLKPLAYAERELAYPEGRSIPTARDLSKLLAIAAPKPTDIVLHPAMGSGYVAALLSQLVEMVVCVESAQHGAGSGEAALADYASNVAVIEGDVTLGAPDQGPFDLIFVAAAFHTIPEKLCAQLKNGGRLVGFLRHAALSKGVLVTRNDGASTVTERFDATVATVPPEYAVEPKFSF